MRSAVPSPADVYDKIAANYRATRGKLAVQHIVTATMTGEIGDVTGLEAIDLATGEGAWARTLKRQGAAYVLGVDVSAEMIRLARAAEAEDPLGCVYVVADVTAFTSERRFDIATAVFLLNYATSHDHLRAMCDAARRLLKPAGRFVGINTSMFLDAYDFDGWTSIGRRMTGPQAPREGDALTITLGTGDGADVVFDNYYLKPETYQAAFVAAGFSSFRWVSPTVTEEGRKIFGDAFWRPLLERPQLIGFEAVA